MDAIHKAAARALDINRQALAEAIARRHYELAPELASRYGEAGRVRCLEDIGYHLGYLSEAMASSSRALFLDYVAWAKAMLEARGIPAQDLARNLEYARMALQQSLPPESATIAVDYLDSALAQLPEAPAEPASFLSGTDALAELAGRYLHLLLRAKRHAAARLILEAVESGIGIKEIYLRVFQPAQYEIGRLWQLNKVSVAQEHYCTAAAQLIMAQLYPQIFRSEKTSRTLVATSIAGELHELGVRMVADLFEIDGWDTYYLGANMPVAGILQAVGERRADMLAISATIAPHLRQVERLIGAARATASGKDMPIIVGGYPFNLEPELWRALGADGCARDVQESVALGNRLLEKPSA